MNNIKIIFGTISIFYIFILGQMSMAFIINPKCFIQTYGYILFIFIFLALIYNIVLIHVENDN